MFKTIKVIAKWIFRKDKRSILGTIEIQINQVKEKLGPRSYCCIVLQNNREIKRHTDQIRSPNLLNENEISNTSVPVTNEEEINNTHENGSSISTSSVVNGTRRKNSTASVGRNSSIRSRLRPRIAGKVSKNVIASVGSIKSL